MEALQKFARTEGVIFALESAHGAAVALELAAELPPERSVVVNMSGRGDKDLFITAPLLRGSAWRDFLESEIRRMDAMASPETAPASPGSNNGPQSSPDKEGSAR
jgi:tryptophan synthase beta chain